MRELTHAEVLQIRGGGNIVRVGIGLARGTGRPMDTAGRLITAYQVGTWIASGYKNHAPHNGLPKATPGSGYGGYGPNSGRIKVYGQSK